jgi:biotin carboxylase
LNVRTDRYQLVRLLYARGRYDEARTVMNELGQSRVSLTMRRLEAELTFLTGDFEQALALAEETVADSEQATDFLWYGQLLARAAHALGIRQGCVHAEVIWDGRTFQMLEMAARGGGGHIYTTIVRFVSGCDLVELSVQLACGWPVARPDVSTSSQRAACYRFLRAPQGILCGISGVDQARRCPLIHEVGFSVAPGQRLGPVTDGATRPGWIVALGASRDEVVKAAERAAERIRFETTPPVNSELLGAECRPSMG